MSAAPDLYFETTQTLSNAINAFLVFGCILSTAIFCDKLQTRYLCLAVAGLALGLNSDLYKLTCGVCAEICRRCAEDCERIGGMDECVQACRRCAESCQRMAA